jgi:hypothetical protein
MTGNNQTEAMMPDYLEAVIKPRPLSQPLEDYWRAPGGVGPLADDWADKPHRLVYDLIAALLDARQRDL